MQRSPTISRFTSRGPAISRIFLSNISNLLSRKSAVSSGLFSVLKY